MSETQPEFTAEERELIAAQREGRLPLSDRLRTPGSPSPASTGVGARIRERLKSRENRLFTGVPYPLPDDLGEVFVFGVSSFDAKQILGWLGNPAPPRSTDLATPEKQAREAFRQASLKAEGAVYTVISQVREGPTREYPRVWDLGDLHDVLHLLPWDTVSEIARIAESRTGTAENLSSSVQQFFLCTQTCSQAWYSASATWESCRTGWQTIRTRLQSLVSAASSAETPGSGAATNELTALLAEMETLETQAAALDTERWQERTERLVRLLGRVRTAGQIDPEAARELRELL